MDKTKNQYSKDSFKQNQRLKIHAQALHVFFTVFSCNKDLTASRKSITN